MADFTTKHIAYLPLAQANEWYGYLNAMREEQSKVVRWGYNRLVKTPVGQAKPTQSDLYKLFNESNLRNVDHLNSRLILSAVTKACDIYAAAVEIGHTRFTFGGKKV